jgi:hypothetical protein
MSVNTVVGDGVHGREFYFRHGQWFFFRYYAQTSWEAGATKVTGSGRAFCEYKAADAYTWPLTSIYCRPPLFFNNSGF